MGARRRWLSESRAEASNAAPQAPEAGGARRGNSETAPKRTAWPRRESGGGGNQGRDANRLEREGLLTERDIDCSARLRQGCIGQSGLSVVRRWWRRRELNPRPRARPRETLHACPLLLSRARREKAAKNRQAPDPVCLTTGRRAAVRPPACLMASDPPPSGKARADAHSLIRLRERTEYPQLTDVPSDLRVNGARHASRESLPPSKPCRPHLERTARRRSSSLIRTIIVRPSSRPVKSLCLQGLSQV